MSEADNIALHRMEALGRKCSIQLETYFDSWRMAVFDSRGKTLGEWKDEDLGKLINTVHKKVFEY